MNIASERRPTASPREDILHDCKHLLMRIRIRASQTDDVAGRSGDRQSLLHDLHGIKGAVGFLGFSDLVNGLHQLEGLLGDPGFTETSELQNILDQCTEHLQRQVSHTVVGRNSYDVHRIGESLWWSNELTQSLAVRLGKRVFIVVRGGELPVTENVHKAMQACLVHLVRNAIVHGIEQPEVRINLGKPAIGLITISAEQWRGCLRVGVTDNGSGIESTDIDSIFEMGRTGVSESSVSGGRGIGLSAVLELVHEKGGEIEVESTVGEGTTFTLVFQQQ